MQEKNALAPSTRPAAKITTQELADILRVKSQTIRAGFCRKGHYLGLRPIKLPNGRNLWDQALAENLTAGGEG